MCNWVERRLPALFVSCCSALVLQLGILMTIESVYIYRETAFANVDFGSLTNQMQLGSLIAMLVMLTISLMPIIIGFLGVCCYCRPFNAYRVFPITFGCLGLFNWFFLLILGVFITSVTVSTSSTMQSFCQGNPINSKLQPIVNFL